MRKYDLNLEEIKNKVPDTPGTYKIFCYKTKNVPLVIPRLLKKDEKGVLSIGSTKHLATRLKQFIRAMVTHSGHSSGNRYGYLDLEDDTKLGKYQLKFSFREEKNYKFSESKKQIMYALKFGELPPLNNKEPPHKHWKKLDRG